MPGGVFQVKKKEFVVPPVGEREEKDVSLPPKECSSKFRLLGSLMIDIYSKSLVRAIGKVILMQFSKNTN